MSMCVAVVMEPMPWKPLLIINEGEQCVMFYSKMTCPCMTFEGSQKVSIAIVEAFTGEIRTSNLDL